MIDDKTIEEIVKAYQTGRTSIQDIARVYRVSVDQVLGYIGEGHLASVHLGGDLIDAQEAGPGATLNYGQEYKIPFSVD